MPPPLPRRPWAALLMDSSGWRGNRISSLSIGSLSLCARALLLCSAVLPATLTPRLVLRLIWASLRCRLMPDKPWRLALSWPVHQS